ncbi:hypothetical protein GCM10017556_24270 [Micromonospora sagamiensis]|nr:hypothetical protein GCM10017556_24270 [Micromonospora sagamiensis]
MSPTSMATPALDSTARTWFCSSPARNLGSPLTALIPLLGAEPLGVAGVPAVGVVIAGPLTPPVGAAGTRLPPPGWVFKSRPGLVRSGAG